MGSGEGPSAQDEVHEHDLKALEIIMEGIPPVMYRLHLAMIKVVSPPKPQRCELKINKLKIKTSIDIESCVDCNYNIGIKNGSCEIGATSRYKICVSQSSGCGF